MARRNSNATKGERPPRRGWSEKNYGRQVRYRQDVEARELDMEDLAKRMGVRFK